MKFSDKNQEAFFKMFLENVRDIYDAELQILDAFPAAIQAAHSKELREALKGHAQETQKQKTRLETVFKKMGEAPRRKTCEGVKGLLEEAKEVITKHEPSYVRDAALILALQKVEHYEIATYGTLNVFASHLDLDEVATILDEILEEEGSANKKLTKLAEGSWLSSGINAKAAHK